jgi:hypothetical protein
VVPRGDDVTVEDESSANVAGGDATISATHH